MKFLSRLLVAGAVVALLASTAQAQLVTVFSDNFEGYTSNGELVSSGNWTENTLGVGLYDGPNTFTLDNKSVQHADADTGTQRLLKTSAWGLNPDTSPIRASFWMYDSATAGSHNGGLSFGASQWTMMAVGLYAVTSQTHYSARIMGTAAGAGWYNLGIPRQVGWHKFSIVLDGDTVSFYHNDGETPVLQRTDLTTKANWGNWTRLAPMANAAGTPIYYDNFLVQTGNPAFTLTYTAGAGGSIVGTSPQYVAPGGNGAEVTAQASTGYHFVQWSDNVMTASRTDTNVTEDISVEAQFALNEYTLTYNAGAGGSIIGTTPQTVNHGADGAPVTADPDSGYKFVQWSDLSTDNPRTDTNVMGNITVTAQFALESEYTVTYTAGPGGLVNGVDQVQQNVVEGGDGPVVTASANTGYTFVDWSDSSIVNPRQDLNVTGNITVTANFAANTYTVTFDPGAGVVAFPTKQVTFASPYGELTTATLANHTLGGWYTAPAGAGDLVIESTSVSIADDHTLYALWNLNQYTLTYTAGHKGSIVGATSQAVDHGSDGTAVEASPAVNYSFVKWSDDVTDNPRTDTNVTGDITVTAVFAPAPIQEYLEDFETATTGAEHMFKHPAFSGSSTGWLAGSSQAGVSEAEANDILDPAVGTPGSKSYRLAWSWSVAGTGFIRATTAAAAGRPTPIIHLDKGFSVYVKITQGEVDMGIYIRETGFEGPIGNSGGTSGGIEGLVPSSRVRLTASPNWQYIHWDIPNEEYYAFAGASANGVLEGYYGVLEALTFYAVDGSPATQIEIFVDDFYQGPPQTPIIPASVEDWRLF